MLGFQVYDESIWTLHVSAVIFGGDAPGMLFGAQRPSDGRTTNPDLRAATAAFRTHIMARCCLWYDRQTDQGSEVGEISCLYG